MTLRSLSHVISSVRHKRTLGRREYMKVYTHCDVISSRAKWQTIWENSKHGKQLRRIDSTPPSKPILNLYKNRSRQAGSIITQLRTGHAALNAFLFKIKAVDSPLCTRCQVPDTSFLYAGDTSCSATTYVRPLRAHFPFPTFCLKTVTFLKHLPLYKTLNVSHNTQTLYNPSRFSYFSSSPSLIYSYEIATSPSPIYSLFFYFSFINLLSTYLLILRLWTHPVAGHSNLYNRTKNRTPLMLLLPSCILYTRYRSGNIGLPGLTLPL